MKFELNTPNAIYRQKWTFRNPINVHVDMKSIAVESKVIISNEVWTKRF